MLGQEALIGRNSLPPTPNEFMTMSLPPISSAFSNMEPGFDVDLPSANELETDTSTSAGQRSAANTESKELAPRPEMKTKKRKREDDGMAIGGAISEECGDDGSEISTVALILERPTKHRRLTPVDADTRDRVSQAIAKGDLDGLIKSIDACPGCLDHPHSLSAATPLLEAVWWGQIGIVGWLLKQGADPNFVGDRYEAFEIEDGSEKLSEDLRERFKPKLQQLRGLSVAEAPVLGGSALLHAATHGELELVKLLIAYGAEVNPEYKFSSPLAGAVAAGHRDVVSYLLQQGADPLMDFFVGTIYLENASAIALKSGQMEIFRVLMESIADENIDDALKKIFCRLENSLSLAHMECLTSAFPDLLKKILEMQSAGGQPWLLELMLKQKKCEIVKFLIDHGVKWKFRSENDLLLAVNVSEDANLVELMLHNIKQQVHKEKFINLCLHQNLKKASTGPGGARIRVCNRWLIVELNASPLFVNEADAKDFPSSLPRVDEYLFHFAVGIGARLEVEWFLERHPAADFHFPGKYGRYPVELAAAAEDEELFHICTNMASGGIRDRMVLLWQQFFDRAALEHQDPISYEFLKKKLLEVGIDPRPSLLENIIDSGHWKSLEFYFATEDVLPDNLSIAVADAAPATDRLMFSDLHFNMSLLKKPWTAVENSLAWNGSTTAAVILESLSRQMGKTGKKFIPSVSKLGRNFGMTGVIIERTIETHAMLNFVRNALLGGMPNPGGLASQFANFMAYWLPATNACDWYLSSDSMYGNPKAFSADFCTALTGRAFRQLDDLHQEGKRRQQAWGRRIADELPALCLRCVDSQTGDVDKPALQLELIQRDMVAPNAIRLADLMQRCYPAASAMTSSVLQNPALYLRHFSAQFATEMGKLIGGDEDNQSNQRATADATILLGKPEYRQLNLPVGMSIDLEVQAARLLPELVWWQMDAIFNCFGKVIDGQAENYARVFETFLKFKKAITNLGFNAMQIAALRPDFDWDKVGSGWRTGW